MTRKYIALAALALLCSCTKEHVQQGMHEICIDAAVESHVQSTKATLITSSNIKTHRIHVDAYTSGKTTNYLSSNVIYDETKWSFFKGNYKDYKYYWPDYKLDFFAYSPYQLDRTRVTLNTYAASQPSFTYTGVSPVNAASQTDDQLIEMVCAYREACDYVNDNPVALAFHHPFTLVNFRLEQSIRCTIVSVKITGVKNNGTCIITKNAPFATWTPSGAATDIVADFSADPAYSANGGIRYPEDINANSHLAGPFMIIPQDIEDDALIEVRYKALGNNTVTVAQSFLNKAVIQSSGTVASSWKPSNSYAYSLTLNGAANELFVAVQIEDWVAEGTTEIEVK